MGGLEFTKNQKLALIAIVGLIAIGVSIRLARNASSPTCGGVTIREPSAGDGVSVTTSDSDSTQPYDPNGDKVTFQVAGWVEFARRLHAAQGKPRDRRDQGRRRSKDQRGY